MQVSVRPSKPSYSMKKTDEVIWSTVNEYGNKLSLKETKKGNHYLEFRISTYWI